MDAGKRLRIQLIALGVLGVLAALTVRCYYLTHIRYEHYRRLADRQQLRKVTEQPLRGGIYDRHGDLLAVSRIVPSLYANPRVIEDPEAVATRLSQLLGRPRSLLARRLGYRKRAFVWLARHLEPRQADAIRALKIKGLGFRREQRRYYPQGALASHLLGFCGTDQVGLEGLELAYDESMRGRRGARVHLRDAKQARVHLAEALGKPGEDGVELELTIDLVVQRIVEQELARAVAEFTPNKACAIVVDAPTGEVLALAGQPTFDPNHFGEAPKEAWRNSALQDTYEPGSTLKPLVAAFGIEEGLVSIDTVFNCHHGRWRHRGRLLHDHGAGHGNLSVAEIVIHSSNIGMAQIGLMLGGARLRRYLKSVGLGYAPEALRLPGAPGRLTPASRWSYYSTTSVPMGHELLCSPLQLAAAINVIAADGRWQPVRVVRALREPGGDRALVGQRLARTRVLSRQTARAMRRVMQRVVEEGTGKRGKVKGVTVGGKTGTAQKRMENGQYSHERYVSSFVAIAPVDRPQLTVVVLMDDPRTDRGKPYGGRVAAPVASAVIRRVMAYREGRMQ